MDMRAERRKNVKFLASPFQFCPAGVKIGWNHFESFNFIFSSSCLLSIDVKSIMGEKFKGFECVRMMMLLHFKQQISLEFWCGFLKALNLSSSSINYEYDWRNVNVNVKQFVDACFILRAISMPRLFNAFLHHFRSLS